MNELYHHGIKGQKWGERNYQYEDGTYTPEGKERYFVTYKRNTGRNLMGNGTPSNIPSNAFSSSKPKSKEVKETTTEKPKVTPLATSGGKSSGKGKSGKKGSGGGKSKKTDEEKQAEKESKKKAKEEKSSKKGEKESKQKKSELTDKETFGEYIKRIKDEHSINPKINSVVDDFKKHLDETGKSLGDMFKGNLFEQFLSKNGITDNKDIEEVLGIIMNRFKTAKHSDCGKGEYYAVTYSSSLKHFGIQGQKWGVRRYQYEDGTYTPEGKERYFKGERKTDTEGNSKYSVSTHTYNTLKNPINNESLKKFDDSVKKMNSDPRDFNSLDEYDKTFFEGYDDLMKYEDISTEMAKKYIEGGRDAAFDYLDSEIGDMPVVIAMSDAKIYDLGVNFVDYSMKVMGKSGTFNVDGSFQYTSSRENGREKRDKGEMLSLDTTWDDKGIDYYEEEYEKEKKKK